MPVATVTVTDRQGEATVGTVGWSVTDGTVISLPQDGSDVTALFVDQINGLTLPAVAVIPPGAYRMESQAKFWSKNGLTISGYGARFYRTINQTLKLRQLSFELGDGVTIKGLTVESTHSERQTDSGYPTYMQAREVEHGIEFRAVDNTLVEDVTVKNVWGDGIYYGSRNLGGGQHRGCLGATVRNVTVDASGRQGIGVAMVDDLLIEDSHIFTGRSGVDLEPPSWDKECNRVTIRRNWIDCGNLPVSNGTGGPAHDVLIEDNEWRSGWFKFGAKNQARRRNWVVRRNRPYVGSSEFANNYVNAAFWVQYVDGIVFEDNVHWIQEIRGKDGIYFIDCTDIKVVNNLFRGARHLWAYSTEPQPWTVYGNTKTETETPGDDPQPGVQRAANS